MRIGVNLPSDCAQASGALLLDWARRADEGPFATLAVTDRLAWSTYEPFATLAAAAALTRRVRLMTAIVIAPLRPAALLAKSAATVDALCGGRLTVGLGIGPRQSDYTAAGVEWRSRGRRFGELLAELRDYWEEGSAVGPMPARRGGPRLVVGGLSDHALARMARHADGYVHGGGPPRAFARAAERARAAWVDCGRPGQPEILGQGYFALGGDAAAKAGVRHLKSYYEFLGPFADKIAAGLLTTPQAVVQYVRGYEEAGCDELLLFAAVPDLAQLARLADVLGAFASPVAREIPA
jgi:alkanesulfonate monooxygenase SsuD/methylene tetrahydromethanopterin reductase-like flavin-dependent oxidoreductase (luciferase family)